MKLNRKTLISRVMATVLILLLTVGLSLAAYTAALRSEEEHCWETLGDAAQSISREVVIRMEDNLSILELAAGALADNKLGSPEDIVEHMNGYADLTMFTRIDVVFPDGSVMMNDGTTTLHGDISFKELAESGIHMSPRMTDHLTGRETVYCSVPAVRNGRTVAALMGVIECHELSDYFRPTVYGGEASCMIVDRSDGNFILDNTYSELGNIYESEEIRGLRDYSDTDLIKAVQEGQEGVIAYVSPRSGVNSYMYYTPISVDDWQLLVMIPEELAFSRHDSLRQALVIVAATECVVILLFVALNLLSINQLAKSKAHAERQLHKSNVLIECVTELSSYSSIDLAIDNLLAIVNRYFDGDRTYLCDVNYENQTTSNLYEYAAEGVSKEIDNLQNVPLSAVEAWLEEFRRTGIFYISDIDRDLDLTSNTYDILSAQNIHSLIAVPLLRGSTIIGYLGVDNPRKEYEDLTLMSSVQFFVTEALERKAHEEALTKMSFTDTLTHLHNRNKFNFICDEYTRHPRRRVGVAFFDLDGLKQVNDTLGHDAGDQLIVSTADGIRGTFSGNSYRIGGDEFAVIVPDIGREDFEIQVDKVRRLMQKNGISVAIGVSWHDSDGFTISQQLKEADGLMYIEKAEHRRLRAEAAAREQEKSAGEAPEGN